MTGYVFRCETFQPIEQMCVALWLHSHNVDEPLRACVIVVILKHLRGLGKLLPSPPEFNYQTDLRYTNLIVFKQKLFELALFLLPRRN